MSIFCDKLICGDNNEKDKNNFRNNIGGFCFVYISRADYGKMQ